MNIIFCNAFHNGDIHYSRTFISNIINDISEIYPDIKFFYYHNNPKELLLDIEKLAYIKAQPQSQTTIRRRFIVQGEDIYINTWVGCWKNEEGKTYCGDNGCTISANKELYEDIYEDISDHLGINLKLPTTNECIPRINYSYYHIEGIDKHIKETKDKFRKRIFISNGITLSGQALNFNFDPIIYDVASLYPDCAFYMTSEVPYSQELLPNVYNTRNIIGYDGCDLNENSYISTKCDYIVGRASGPFAFAHVQENYMDKNKTICAISNSKFEGFWYDGGEVQYDWINTLGWTENITTMSIVRDKLIEFCER